MHYVCIQYNVYASIVVLFFNKLSKLKKLLGGGRGEREQWNPGGKDGGTVRRKEGGRWGEREREATFCKFFT